MKQLFYTTQSHFPIENKYAVDKDLADAGYLHKIYNGKPLLFCPDDEIDEFRMELERALNDKVILTRV